MATATAGRLVFDISEKDDWKVQTFFKGIAGSGHKTSTATTTTSETADEWKAQTFFKGIAGSGHKTSNLYTEAVFEPSDAKDDCDPAVDASEPKASLPDADELSDAKEERAPAGTAAEQKQKNIAKTKEMCQERLEELTKLRHHLASASDIGKKLCHPDSPDFPDVTDDPLRISPEIADIAKCTLQAINACLKLESYHRIIRDSIGDTYGMSRKEKGEYYMSGRGPAPARGPTTSVEEVD